MNLARNLVLSLCFTTLAMAFLPGWAQAAECVILHETGTYEVCESRSPRHPEWLAGLSDAQAHADSSIRVVVFDGPITRAQQSALDATGAERLDYLPRNAYIVRMDAALDAAARAVPGVIWTGPMLPVWKLGFDLVESRVDAVEAEAFPINVSLWQGESATQRQNDILAIPGVQRMFEQQGPDRARMVISVRGEHFEAVIRELAAQDAVAGLHVQRDVTFRNSQAGWLHQSGTVDNTPIFDQGIYGCGQTIGVLDSGMDFGHCAFVDPDEATPPVSDCSNGADCPAGTPDPDQRKISIYYKWSGGGNPLGDATCNPITGAGHGTHVAASAVGNNVNGAASCEAPGTPGNLTNLDGTAPGAKLVAQEMGGSLQYINNLGGSLYHAGSTAYENGARIHNNSWGAACRNPFTGACIPGCTNYGTLARDADMLAWDFPELAVFVAAGNDGSACTESVGAPGNAKNVFSIGSNNRGTGGEAVTGFSSRGPIIDGRTKPDLLAQGSSIVSAASNGNPNTTTCGTCAMGGTSMASPTAAGAAALVREYLERGFYPSGLENAADAITTPSSALIKSIMINSARFLTGTGGGAGPNQNQGWGRVTLDDALYFDGDPRQLWIVDRVDGLETGEVHQYPLAAGDDQPLKITLTWNDFPAAVSAGVHLVNELRLEVETPSGEIWTQKLSGGPNPFQDTVAGDYDNLNNVHQIVLDTPEAGGYLLRVRGINVPQGDAQPYALVATGTGVAIVPGSDPQANITPAVLSIEAPEGGAGDATLNIGNFGGSDLVWSIDTANAPAAGDFAASTRSGGEPDVCDTPANIPWLGVSPNSGTTSLGGNVPVSVTVDASGLTQGDYAALLCVTTNDAEATLVEIPVNLTVTGEVLDPPHIEIDPTSLSATLDPDNTDIQTLDISNPGDETLEWELVDEDGITGGAMLRARGNAPIVPGAVSPRTVDGVSRSALGAAGERASPGFKPRGGTTMTHSDSFDILSQHAVACSPDVGVTTALNTFLRRFDLPDFGIDDPFTISEVTFGVEVLTGSVSQPITVNLYELDGTFLYANMTLIGSETVTLSPQEATLVDVSFSGVTASAGSSLVVELDVGDFSDVSGFFPGSNEAGETAPSFIGSPCAGGEPVTFASIGFPQVHLVMAVTGSTGSVPGCELPADVSWLDVTPTSGMVAGEGSETLSVTFDSTGLTTGVYETRVCVASNAANNPLLVVPVSLHIPGSDDLFRDCFEEGSHTCGAQAKRDQSSPGVPTVPVGH